MYTYISSKRVTTKGKFCHMKCKLVLPSILPPTNKYTINA